MSNLLVERLDFFGWSKKGIGVQALFTGLFFLGFSYLGIEGVIFNLVLSYFTSYGLLVILYSMLLDELRIILFPTYTILFTVMYFLQ